MHHGFSGELCNCRKSGLDGKVGACHRAASAASDQGLAIGADRHQNVDLALLRQRATCQVRRPQKIAAGGPG